VLDKDPLVSMAIDAVELAIADYRAGPGPGVGDGAARCRQDYESACAFLERAGLLEQVHARLGAPEACDVAQFSLL
jgi:hypothetical protein